MPSLHGIYIPDSDFCHVMNVTSIATKMLSFVSSLMFSILLTTWFVSFKYDGWFCTIVCEKRSTNLDLFLPNGHSFVDSPLIQHRNSTSKVRSFIFKTLLSILSLSFAALSVTETHARHRCSGCCLDIIAKIKNKKLLSIAPPSKLLSVHLKTASFFFLLKRSRFPSPLLLYSHVYWQRKLLKENSKYHKVNLVLWYLGEKWTLKNKEITSRR